MKSEKIKMGQRGFTLIELLIVIALIGILAVALLSAINPLEQLRKGRDSARKADASELLNAVERFYASYQCYPWSYDATNNSCSATGVPLSGSPNPIFTAAGNVNGLLDSNELKGEFATRVTTSGNPSNSRLFITEVGGSAQNAGPVVTCFEPESSTGRSGGLGRTVGSTNGTGSASCTAAYTGGTSASNSCYICLPQ